jgi:hypothetical protein
MSHFGYLVGSATAGIMLDQWGFSWVFLTVASIQTACVFTSCITMQGDSTPPVLETEVEQEERNGGDEKPFNEVTPIIDRQQKVDVEDTTKYGSVQLTPGQSQWTDNLGIFIYF